MIKKIQKADYSIETLTRTRIPFLIWMEHRLARTLAMGSNIVELKRVGDELTLGIVGDGPKSLCIIARSAEIRMLLR